MASSLNCDWCCVHVSSPGSRPDSATLSLRNFNGYWIPSHCSGQLSLHPIDVDKSSMSYGWGHGVCSPLLDGRHKCVRTETRLIIASGCIIMLNSCNMLILFTKVVFTIQRCQASVNKASLHDVCTLQACLVVNHIKLSIIDLTPTECAPSDDRDHDGLIEHQTTYRNRSTR